jgi:hypothetical protein
VPTVSALYETLDHMVGCAQRGAKPILHLDMHGSKDGLAIADTHETAPWTLVVPRLRAINIATRGNLCVVAGVCFALHAITRVRLPEPEMRFENAWLAQGPKVR